MILNCNRDRRIYCLACAKIFKPSQTKGGNWQLATGNWPQKVGRRLKIVNITIEENRKERDLLGMMERT